MTIPDWHPANGMPLLDSSVPGATLHFAPDWLAAPEADALLAHLQRDIAWEVHRIRMFGRLVDSPRLSRWVGDTGAVYRYSGSDFLPQAWTPALEDLRGRLQEELGARFNSVLLNLYRDGRDAMGWHSDDEPELGPRPVIASVSLGAVRRFALRDRRESHLRQVLELPHGSLLVMSGDTQRLCRHALPRTARLLGPRINLTFRWIDPARRR